MSSWVFSNTTWGVCGVFALLSLIITCHQIYQHLFHWTKPIYQKWIVRILFMVPVYAFASWLSLKFYDDSVYFDTVRNCYESFVIYSFLSLCFAYLGGESALVHALTGRFHKPTLVTMTCCIKPFPYSIAFLRFCKQCTLQFCFVKPLTSLATIILEAYGLFEEGDMDPRRGYLYVAIAYNISIFMAMMGLVWFYQATADLLAPHKPVLKFLIVKSVIFLAFWQGMGLSIAGAAGAFRNETQVSNGELSAAYQNVFICIEMFFISILHLKAFSVQPFLSTSSETTNAHALARVSSNLKSVISPKDLVHDTIRNFSSKYNKYHHQSNAESDESDQEAPGEDEERRVGLDPINEAAPGSMAAMDPDRFSVGSWGEETAMGHVRHLKQPDARQSLMQPDSDEEGNSII